MKKTSLVLIILLSMLYMPSSFGDKNTDSWHWIISHDDNMRITPWAFSPNQPQGELAWMFHKFSAFGDVYIWSGIVMKDSSGNEDVVRVVYSKLPRQRAVPYSPASKFLRGAIKVPVTNCDWFSNSDGKPRIIYGHEYKTKSGTKCCERCVVVQDVSKIAYDAYGLKGKNSKRTFTLSYFRVYNWDTERKCKVDE